MFLKSILMTAALATTILAAPAPEPRTRTTTVWATYTSVVVVDPQGNTIPAGVEPTAEPSAALPEPTWTPTAPSSPVISTPSTMPSVPASSTTVASSAPQNSDGPDPLDYYAPVGDHLYPNAMWGTKWARKIVAAHNIHRANHSVGRLRWDGDLAVNAYNWANKCIWDHNGDSASGNWTAGSYGQNILTAGNGRDNPALDISTAWYNGEYDLYVACSENFTLPQPKEPKDVNPNWTGEWGHLTAMLWKDTTAVGCAHVECKDRVGGLQKVSAGTVQNMFVCNYGAWGNWGGQYAKNVLPPNGRFGPSSGDFIKDLA